MNQSMDKLAAVTRQVRDYEGQTPGRVKTAKRFLENSDGRAATVLLMALRTLCGPGVLAWEPESIWLTLERDHGIDLPEVARDKVQAAITLIINPSFFWDNLVFQRTTKALNGEIYDPSALQECHPAHMNWAVYEARIIRGHDPDTDDAEAYIELDEDVQQYVAVCLHRAGYSCPPHYLHQVADNLQAMIPAENHLEIGAVKKRWQHLDKGGLPDRVFQETPLGIQLSHLAACYVYAQEQAQNLAKDVLTLEKEISL